MKYRAKVDVWISQIPVLLKAGEMFEYPEVITNDHLEWLDRPAPVPAPAKAPAKPKAPPKKKAAPK